jgi:nucleoid DNA-binding protein
MPRATAPKPVAKTAKKTATKSKAKPGTKPVVEPVPTPAVAAVSHAAAGADVTAPNTGGKTDKAMSGNIPMLRSRDLIARVVEATGGKVRDVRQTVEATLAELGKAVDLGQSLQLPPLGKLLVAPRKGADDMSPIKLKLRRASDPAVKKASKKEALAEQDEAS